MTTDRHELRAPAVIYDDLDGEIVAIDLESGRYYRMTGVARQVWSWVIGGSTSAEIAEASDHPAAGDAVAAFVAQLAGFDLIRPGAAAGAGPASDPPGYWELGPLEVELFSDLEDILGLDPIHEIDPEVGWKLGGG